MSGSLERTIGTTTVAMIRTTKVQETVSNWSSIPPAIVASGVELVRTENEAMVRVLLGAAALAAAGLRLNARMT